MSHSPRPGLGDSTYSPVDLDAHQALRAMLSPLLDPVAAVDYYSPDGRPYDRREADGFITVRVTHPYGSFGIVCNDFKLKGGSFSHDNSGRVAAFVDEMGAEGLPLVLVIDSMGVRLMDGRAVVKPAFGIIPSLLRFRDCQLLVTCIGGRALGLGAVLCAAGHYRLAIAGKSLTNLAGPEIMRMFFGESVDFGALAAPERQLPGSTLVNELAASRALMLAKARSLVDVATRTPAPPVGSGPLPAFPTMSLGQKPETKLAGILASISDGAIECFGCLAPSVRVYIATRHGRRFGVLANPPGNPDNLITAHTLDKYMLALDLFRALGLPVVSFLDTPGGDPRDNSDVILKLWQTCQRIIDYPCGLMGVCIGRGYGGAIALGFPRFFGSRAAYVLAGAGVGLMHPHLIDSLLSSSKTLSADWNAAKTGHTADCADLVTAGIIDGMLSPADVPAALERFLRDTVADRVDPPTPAARSDSQPATAGTAVD